MEYVYELELCMAKSNRKKKKNLSVLKRGLIFSYCKISRGSSCPIGSAAKKSEDRGIPRRPRSCRNTSTCRAGRKRTYFLSIFVLYGSMEQKGGPKNKPTHLWSINSWQRGQAYTMEKDTLQQWCWKSWTTTYKSMTLERTLSPYTKINPK